MYSFGPDLMADESRLATRVKPRCDEVALRSLVDLVEVGVIEPAVVVSDHITRAPTGHLHEGEVENSPTSGFIILRLHFTYFVFRHVRHLYP